MFITRGTAIMKLKEVVVWMLYASYLKLSWWNGLMMLESGSHPLPFLLREGSIGSVDIKVSVCFVFISFDLTREHLEIAPLFCFTSRPKPHSFPKLLFWGFHSRDGLFDECLYQLHMFHCISVLLCVSRHISTVREVYVFQSICVYFLHDPRPKKKTKRR